MKEKFRNWIPKGKLKIKYWIEREEKEKQALIDFGKKLNKKKNSLNT